MSPLDPVDSITPPLAAAAPAAPTPSRLGLQLDDQYWLVDLAEVSEVVPVPVIVDVPLTKPWYAGVANIRGNLISIVDFSAFTGGPSVVVGDRARLVLIADKHRLNCGLLFSRIVGLRHLERFERENDVTQMPAWIESCYRDADGQRWRVLDMHALVMHPEFLQVELQFQ